MLTLWAANSIGRIYSSMCCFIAWGFWCLGGSSKSWPHSSAPSYNYLNHLSRIPCVLGRSSNSSCHLISLSNQWCCVSFWSVRNCRQNEFSLLSTARNETPYFADFDYCFWSATRYNIGHSTYCADSNLMSHSRCCIEKTWKWEILILQSSGSYQMRRDC